MPDVTPHAPLPIFEVLPQVRAALQASPLALLQAPTGAGKSTGLPLAALREGWLADWTGEGKILLLQPRRVAARAVAARMAAELGEEVGGAVGLRVRFETLISSRSRLEVMTEGVLIRRLQSDPELSGVGLVIFDEFHERSLDADLGLALVREVQGALRDDLKVLVMSATLDPGLPAQLGAPLITSEGRSFPVEVRYLAADPTDPVAAMPGVIVRAAQEHEGDILAFLPGARDIADVQGALLKRPELAGLDILLLYGDLSVSEQQKALKVGERRRVILATNIAETSLTLPGVRVVVDSGLGRVQRFDPGTSLSRLVTERVSKSSATQRSGRAGRVAPGVAYRLWSERTHATLPQDRAPEILSADLTGLSLELAGWGSEAARLPWLDAPPPTRLELARSVLTELGALDEGRVTPLGSALLEWPTHPRLARMLLGAQEVGLGALDLGALAADLAALLEERDPLRSGGGNAGADLGERLLALRRFRQGQPGAADYAVLERIERLSQQWRGRLRVPALSVQPEPYVAGRLLLLAYPERAAQSREAQRGRYLLASGQGVALAPGDALAGEPYLVVAALDMAPRGGPQFAGSNFAGSNFSGPNEGRIFLAAPLDPAHLPTVTAQRLEWDSRTDALSAQQEERYGALVLASKPLTQVPETLRVQAVTDLLRREGLDALNWTKAAQQLIARIDSLRHWRGVEEGWPDVSIPALQADLEWLEPYLGQVRRREDLGKVDLYAALQTLLPWNLTRELSELAPTHLTVPSGNSVALEYRLGGEAPILAVKLQELFGLADTPTVNAGRNAVLLHLLSPARRPVQVTQDLRSFWQHGYFEIRKELRGQYPKHPWPDDPWTHAPTRVTKKQMMGNNGK